MLHIVKQFMSALTMGLKLGLDSGNSNVDTTENCTDSQPKELQKQKMLDYIDSLNTLEDDRLDSADSVFDTQDLVKSELADILVELGFKADAEAIKNGILISEIKQKIEQKFAIQESVKNSCKEEREELSADIISQFEKLEWETYNNFQFNKTVQNLQYFLVSQGLLSRNQDSTDGKWGPTTRKAFETYKNNQTLKMQQQVSVDVSNNQEAKPSNKKEVEKIENYQTLEKGVKTSKEEFMGIKFDKLTKNEILKEVHQGTLNDILANGNAAELAIELRTALETDNLSTYTYKNTLGFRNYSDAVDILETNGYKVKGGFLGTVEALGVIGTIDGVAKTQELLKNVDDYNEKLKIIFDYNADGLLDSKTAFYTQEREMFDAVKDQQGFENVLKNLGYENLDQFNAEFENNYYSARENFKTQLARVLHSEYVISPNLMIQDSQAREKLNSSLQVIADKAEDSIRDNAKIQEIQKEYPELSQEIQKRVVEQTKDFYLQHISGSIGEYDGVAVTFNVQELTDNIIDTVSVGIINDVFGIHVGKEVHVSDDGKLRVGAGLVNFYPYVSGNYKFNEGNIGELQNLFQRTSTETGYNASVGGALSIAPVAGVQVEKMDEDTVEGITKMAEQMSVMIDQVLDAKSFDNLGLSEDNRDAYEGVKALQKASGDTQVAREQLKQGIINNFQRELVRDASSFNITGISLGLILKENYLPVFGVHGEMKSQTWEKVKTINSFEYSSNQVSEATNYSTIEQMIDLDSDLSTYRQGFSEKTRWNKGALGVLTPTNSLEKRWESLVDLADGPQALIDINFLNFLEFHKDSTDDQKLAIISKVSSWMREGRQIKNAQSIEEVIDIDTKRRDAFNTTFGFDASKYAQSYYDKLSALEKLSMTGVHGTAFDAVSTLHVEEKHRVSGIDILHGSLDAIADKNGDMLMVEIKDRNDTLAFANTIDSVNPDLSQLIRDDKVTLYFYKDPDGFDDRILPVINESNITTTETLGEGDNQDNVSVYQTVNEFKTWSLFGTKEQDDKITKVDSGDTDPKVDNGGQTDQNGGTAQNPGQDTGSGKPGFDPNNPNPSTGETPIVINNKTTPGVSSSSKVGMGKIMTDKIY